MGRREEGMAGVFILWDSSSQDPGRVTVPPPEGCSSCQVALATKLFSQVLVTFSPWSFLASGMVTALLALGYCTITFGFP